MKKYKYRLSLCLKDQNENKSFNKKGKRDGNDNINNGEDRKRFK